MATPSSTANVLLNELGDRALRARGLQKLDLRVAYLEEGGGHLLVFHDFLLVAFETQYVLVILDSLFEIRHCDADVLNV